MLSDTKYTAFVSQISCMYCIREYSWNFFPVAPADAAAAAVVAATTGTNTSTQTNHGLSTAEGSDVLDSLNLIPPNHLF